ncbi:acyltransferase domain-containing protein, partial [Streptomyces palmae]|uniref:acyltransferase domain-containing protein n=1 Tax=Streptomyces palmae TaxID=1701085 RepID=UPI0035EF8408
HFPTFAETFDEISEHLNPHLNHPLQDITFNRNPNQPDLIHHTTYTQTSLFALHISLARLLTTLGLTPDAVIGHSIGEISAAHIAGILNLPDACHLIATRATLMGQLPPNGTMTAIQATPQELTPHLDQHPNVTIAALNTPTTTIISGPTQAITTITNHWKQQGRKTKQLNVSHAFHSPLMQPILKQFTQAITHLTYHPPHTPLISNLTGKPATHHITTPDYWTQHIHQPVHFHPAITHLTPTTHTYLEISPTPTLTHAIQHTLEHHQNTNPESHHTPITLCTLNSKQPDTHAL